MYEKSNMETYLITCKIDSQCIKRQRHYFSDKSVHSQSYDFSSSHVREAEL